MLQTNQSVSLLLKKIMVSGCPDTHKQLLQPAPSTHGCASSSLFPISPSVKQPPMRLPQRALRSSVPCLPSRPESERRHSTCAKPHRVCQYACGNLHPAATSPAPSCSADIPG